jgi:hypothetical protein
MKLSEAIREGYKKVNYRQKMNSYFTTDCNGTVTSACALGCVILGEDIPIKMFLTNDSGFLPFIEGGYSGELVKRHPELNNVANKSYFKGDIFGLLVFLNDTVQWTISEIVRELESMGY